MHLEKTRIICCRDDDRKENHPDASSDFLGYTFKSRKSRNWQGNYFTGFLPAISDKAAMSIREKIREWKLPGRSGSKVNTIAAAINPVLRGWINYYGHYYKSALQDVLGYLNLILKNWTSQKYKKLHGHRTKASKWIVVLYQRAPHLFVHLKIGTIP
jgi:RNA-directed DNA polymerase